jgi:hypothetical protein
VAVENGSGAAEEQWIENDGDDEEGDVEQSLPPGKPLS